MSMFFCVECDNLRDGDDGCEEGPNNTLICVECAEEMEAEAELAAEEAEADRIAAINVGGKRDGGSAA
jgi:hypothetical protein